MDKQQEQKQEQPAILTGELQVILKQGGELTWRWPKDLHPLTDAVISSVMELLDTKEESFNDILGKHLEKLDQTIDIVKKIINEVTPQPIVEVDPTNN